MPFGPTSNIQMLHTDMLGRTIQLPAAPRRIVSLVPSQTELLFDLGLDEEVVGITKFCVRPEAQFRRKPRVGGTKKVHRDRIDALRPDLIIANKEENEREQIEDLMRDYPVWVSDVPDLEAALDMIGRVGILCDRKEQAEVLIDRIRTEFAPLSPRTLAPLRTAYLIWRDPYLVAGGGTFIDAMLQQAGLQNVFGKEPRYPQVDPDEFREAQPQLVLLSSEPFPFREKHRAELADICPNSVILLVDGELFSWYGSRLLHAGRYLRNLRSQIQRSWAM